MNVDNINSLPSEAGLLATLIHHPELYFCADDRLLPNHFSEPSNRLLYTAIQELIISDITTIDAYNIMESLVSETATQKKAEVLSGNMTLESVQEFIETSYTLARETAEEYRMLAENILDAAFRRDAYSALKDCEALCLDGRRSSKEIQMKMYDAVESITCGYSVVDEIPKYSDVVDDMWEEIESRQGAGYAGIPFKFPLLNEYVTIERGELVIFGALQKVGKSIMLLNCAYDLIKQGYSVMYIDSELSTRMFTARLLAHISGVEYKRLTSGNYTPEEKSKILEAKEFMKEAKFTHIYMPFFDAENIYSAVKRVHCREKIDVLIVDYFKSTGNEMDAFQTYASMGKCVDLIKNQIAGSMNIAALGAAQATINGRLADSAKIARNASTIVMLVDKTPDEIARDGEECGNKKMIVTVNRNGMQHASGEYISMNFDGNHILYEQAQQHIPQTPF